MLVIPLVNIPEIYESHSFRKVHHDLLVKACLDNLSGGKRLYDLFAMLED
jgi:hypothetical protein